MLSILSTYKGKERTASLCPTSTSEHPIRWYPGHQPGKVDTGEEPPREDQVLNQSPTATPARAFGQVSVWPLLNTMLFLLFSAIKKF